MRNSNFVVKTWKVVSRIEFFLFFFLFYNLNRSNKKRAHSSSRHSQSGLDPIPEDNLWQQPEPSIKLARLSNHGLTPDHGSKRSYLFPFLLFFISVVIHMGWCRISINVLFYCRTTCGNWTNTNSTAYHGSTLGQDNWLYPHVTFSNLI